jgi:hypothetical protein
MKRALLLLAVLAADVAPGRVQGQVGSLKITGMYSTLERKPDHKVHGMEVYILYGGEKIVALVQCAGGLTPAAPVLAPVSLTGVSVSFELPAGLPECGKSFKGVITQEGLKGRFEGEGKDRLIPRRRGFWE